MQVFDSKKKKLGMQEILVRAMENQKESLGVPLEHALLQIVAELQMEGSEAIQFGNTLFVTHYAPESKTCVMYALNVDTARNYINNGELYVRRLIKKGIKGFVTSYTTESFGVPFKQIEKNKLGVVETRKKNGKFMTVVQFNKPRNQGQKNV